VTERHQTLSPLHNKHMHYCFISTTANLVIRGALQRAPQTHNSLTHKLHYKTDYKLAVLGYKYIHGLAPSYLADELHHPAESEFRRRLCSASSHELSVPRTRLSTYGDRAFPVAAVWIWNSLPQHITSAPLLPVFCSHLKTYIFELCYP